MLLANFENRGYPLWHSDEAPHRLDGRTWGAFVVEQDGLDVLAAPDVNPRELTPLLDRARQDYAMVCFDLSEGTAAQNSYVLRTSEAIFMVSGSSRASLEAVQEKMENLESLHAEERCALLLYRENDGLSAADAEQVTGLPVCGYIDTTAQIAQLGHWLAASAAEPQHLGQVA